MTATAQVSHPSPIQKVAALKQKMSSRATGGCVYILSDELDILLALASEGASSLERREALFNALRKQGHFMST